MGKGKAPAAGGVPNRPLYCRASFLYQAAAQLAEAQNGQERDARQETPETPALRGMSRRLLTDLRSVSLKTMMRLNPSIKRTVCKFCDTLLVEGQTCTSVVENRSKGGRKPWADVLVITCSTCGGAKRFPVAAARPPRKSARPKAAQKEGK